MRCTILSEFYIKMVANSHHSIRNGIQHRYSSSVQSAKSYKSIPGLSSLPILGTMHHFLPIVGQFEPKTLFELVDKLFEKFGPIVKMKGIFGRPDMVLLFEPEYIDQVFRSQESNPLRPGFESMQYYREVLKKDIFEGAYGLTTAQGPKWHNFRRKVNPTLLNLKLVRVYSHPLDEIAQDFTERLKKLKDDPTYLTDNFLIEITKWSVESIAFVGLGARLGCLTDELKPEHPASKLMKCSKDILLTSMKFEFVTNMWKYITTSAFKELMKTYDVQWEISTMYIKEAKKRIEERGHAIPEQDKSIVEKLLAIDERVAVVMAIEMMMAGVDTVTFAAISLLYHLASNQEKQDKLREEIRSEDGRKQYLKACIKEALRIWHVVPANLRRTDKDHVVGGYHIPAGVDVLVPNEFLSTLEKYYPRPNEFLPERWLTDKTNPLHYGKAHPMVNLPFGFGIRSCVGRRIAELEIEILMKTLIGEFKVTWDGPPLKVVKGVTNTFVNPFHFRFHVPN